MTISVFSVDELFGWGSGPGSGTINIAYPNGAAAYAADPTNAFLVVVYPPGNYSATDHSADACNASFGNLNGVGFVPYVAFQGGSNFLSGLIAYIPLSGWDGISNSLIIGCPSGNQSAMITSIQGANNPATAGGRPGVFVFALTGVPLGTVPTIHSLGQQAIPAASPLSNVFSSTRAGDLIAAAWGLGDTGGGITASMSATGGSVTPTTTPQWPTGTGAGSHSAGAEIGQYAISPSGDFTVTGANSGSTGAQPGDAISGIAFKVPNGVTVPNVVGAVSATGQATLVSAGLTVGAITTAASSTVPAGSIISQGVAGGAYVLYGATVSLVVSSGDYVTVPNIVGDQQAVGDAAILAARLITGAVTPQSSATIPAGQIISQSPSSGTVVLAGSAVNYVKSIGALNNIPDVVNSALSLASSTLASSGFTVGTVSQASSSTIIAGNVISQSIPAGTPAAPGTPVNIVVSTGQASYKFNPSLGELSLYILNLCGIRPGAISQEHMETLRIASNMLLGRWSSQGVNLWAVDLQTIALVQGVATYPVLNNTIAMLDAYITQNSGGATNTDRLILPISRTEYASYPNKTQQGFPTTFWFDRLLSPNVTLWPVPDGNEATFSYYRVRQIQDASFQEAQNVEIPYYFQDAFTFGVAQRIAMIWAPERAASLKTMADEAYQIAANQNVETAQQYISPMISGYFRP